MKQPPPIRELKPGRGLRNIAVRWREMRNKAMAEKLSTFAALSVLDEGEAIGGGLYKLQRFVEDRDYCDPVNEYWIWSIGRNRATSEIIASIDSDLYQDEAWECLFLR